MNHQGEIFQSYSINKRANTKKLLDSNGFFLKLLLIIVFFAKRWKDRVFLKQLITIFKRNIK